jgi:hypothetical protein
MLARLEAAFFPENPATRLTVVPGTVSVKSRPGDELSSLWTFETSLDFSEPSDIKNPPAGPLGPNGEVQPFNDGDFFAFTFTGKRFILGYIIEPGAGSLDILVDDVLDHTIPCAGSGPVAALDVKVWDTLQERKVTVRRADDSATVTPRVLAYFMDNRSDPNQLMHSNTAHGGTRSDHWVGVLDGMNEWWRLLSLLPNDPIGVDFVYWNVGGNDIGERLPSTAPGPQEDVRTLLERTISEHAVFWANVEFRPQTFPETVPYSYPPLVVYNLPHDRAWDPPPRYDYRSAAYEAAITARPTVAFGGTTHNLPFPVDVYNAAWHKTLPGVPVSVTDPPLPPLPGNYVDPRGWTSDGIHYNEAGGVVQADEIVRYLVFPGLAIGSYDLPF